MNKLLSAAALAAALSLAPNAYADNYPSHPILGGLHHRYVRV